MLEIFGNAWDYYGKEGYVVVITTNGYINKNGACVMGAGIAKECRDRFSGIDLKLGREIKEKGNVVIELTPNIMSFPVKHNFYEMADEMLIVKSAIALRTIALNNPDKKYIIPRVGCGNGRLKWDYIKPKIENILPDNVLAIHFEGGK